MSKSSFIKLILVLVIVLAVGVGWRILKPDDLTTTEAFWIVDPVTMGGEKLPGTEDIDRDFSISPNGQWIVYPSKHGTFYNPLLVLYDVKKRERDEIGLSPKAKELSAMGFWLLGVGCWNSDSTQVFLPALDNPYTLFMADMRAEELQWEAIEVDRQTYYHYEDCLSLSDAANYIRIIQHSPREILLVDAENPQKILASHKAAIPMRRINVEGDLSYTPDGEPLGWVGDLSYSPDFKQVAYVVEGDLLFSTPGRGYVLDLKSAGRPRFLGAPVYGPIRWGPDSNTIYATAEHRSDPSIYVWKLNVER
jgi:hypothetical protein